MSDSMSDSISSPIANAAPLNDLPPSRKEEASAEIAMSPDAKLAQTSAAVEVATAVEIAAEEIVNVQELPEEDKEQKISESVVPRTNSPIVVNEAPSPRSREGATMHAFAGTEMNSEAKLAPTSQRVRVEDKKANQPTYEDSAEDPSFHAQDWTKNLAASAEKTREIKKLKTVCKRFSVEQLNDYLDGHKGEKRYMFFSRHQQHTYQVKVINAIIASKEDNDT
jgi:hypothetical protein